MRFVLILSKREKNNRKFEQACGKQTIDYQHQLVKDLAWQSMGLGIT